MVRVCDEIMGTGKSSAAITYMNEHPEKRYIYITPYLDETKRIAFACRDLCFEMPKKLNEYSGSKTLHSEGLIQRGANISTTHQAFRYYPQEMIDLIKEMHYTAIIDENLEAMDKLKEDPYDVQMAIDAGYVEERPNGICHLVNDAYKGKTHQTLFRDLRVRDIIKFTQDNKESFYFWRLSPELITAFDDVFVLTYMFDGQGLHHMFQMNGIDYTRVYIQRSEAGTYRFTEDSSERYRPDYVNDLAAKIHILHDDKLNAIGDDFFDLSSNWFKKDSSDLEQLKNNVYNFYNNRHRGTPYSNKLWSTFKDAGGVLRGKGYSNRFLQFKARATNDYKDCDVLAYMVNIFMDVGERQFYEANGVEIDEGRYALSIMVQWIWRSAIRDGGEIWVYIPSSRMRRLLENWIEEVSHGTEACDAAV